MSRSRHPFPCYRPCRQRPQLRATVPLLAIRSSLHTTYTASSSLLQLPKVFLPATTIVDFPQQYTQRIAPRQITQWPRARSCRRVPSFASSLAQHKAPQHLLVAFYCPQTLVQALRPQLQVLRMALRLSDSHNGRLHALCLLWLSRSLLYLHNGGLALLLMFFMIIWSEGILLKRAKRWFCETFRE